jgi:hypothetical protein
MMTHMLEDASACLTDRAISKLFGLCSTVTREFNTGKMCGSHLGDGHMGDSQGVVRSGVRSSGLEFWAPKVAQGRMATARTHPALALWIFIGKQAT